MHNLKLWSMDYASEKLSITVLENREKIEDQVWAKKLKGNSRPKGLVWKKTTGVPEK